MGYFFSFEPRVSHFPFCASTQVYLSGWFVSFSWVCRGNGTLKFHAMGLKNGKLWERYVHFLGVWQVLLRDESLEKP